MSAVYRGIITVADRFVPDKLRPLWNHPAGKKLIFCQIHHEMLLLLNWNRYNYKPIFSRTPIFDEVIRTMLK